MDASFIDLIREFGFPTFVCMWLMWRDNKRSALMLTTQNRMMVLLSVLVQVQGIRPEASPEVDVETSTKESR
jgi:hypothetical protein